ncbi:hypothetical protein GR254_14430, partial [Mycobacterium tuberculosis]|nr:hypothetical protein [Mycobacterium tuberculosis]MXI80969.1 hypothetical protein [Mycobacterium tuberculosis]
MWRPRHAADDLSEKLPGVARRHRRNLQLIGLNDAEKRWVLKNPSHLF